MKLLKPILFATLAATIVIGCSSIGTTPTPPTKFERQIFDVSPSTNMVPVITTDHYTNTDGSITSNTTTNLEAVIGSKLTPSVATKESVGTIRALVDAWAPGVGTLVGSALMGALGVWARMRSQKNAAPVLAQNIETILEFLSTLPDGAKYRALLTTYMEKYQLEAGSASTVLSLIQKYVSNPEAKGAAAELQAALLALK